MYTLKIYNSFFGGTPFLKVDEIQEVEIEENLDSFDICNVVVPFYKDSEGNLNCSGLREFQRVQVVESGYFDTVIFEGYIYKLEPNFSRVTLRLRDYKELLSRKVLFSDKSYTDETLDTILTDIIGELNARSSGDTNPEAWSFSIDNAAIGITKDFSKGATYYNILTELATASGKNWRFSDNSIIFKEIIGEDKTTGENFTELTYDVNAPDENNITNIGVDRYSTIENSILTSTTNVENSDSIEENGRIEKYNDISGTELTNYLAEISQDQRLYDFDVDYKKINTILHIGDKVSVSIQSGIDFLDITGDLFITRRKVKILGGEIVLLNVDTSDVVVKKTGLIESINKLQVDVKKLLL
jgi:hypothetical protein